MERNNIEVTVYNPLWPEQFEALKAIYAHCLGECIQGIEHVGSTSVPGLAAKPVLDIDLIITDEQQLREVTTRLVSLGYQFMGDLGIKDRYAFKAMPTTPDTGTPKTWPTHNLYCCVQNSVSLRNHLALRDALRNDPELKAEYGALK